MKRMSQRVVSVKVEGVVLVSVYMPVWSVGREEEIEVVKEEVVEQAGWAGQEDILVIGGDWNAHVGNDNVRAGVCGRFGLRSSNMVGGRFVEWLGENGWCWANSFFNHKRRGTWFSQIHRQWYELDVFVMREEQRHRYAKRMRTKGEAAISDHKPKWMVVDLGRKKWRRGYEAKRVPAINWEALKNERVAERYHREVEQRLRS